MHGKEKDKHAHDAETREGSPIERMHDALEAQRQVLQSARGVHKQLYDTYLRKAVNRPHDYSHEIVTLSITNPSKVQESIEEIRIKLAQAIQDIDTQIESLKSSDEQIIAIKAPDIIGNIKLLMLLYRNRHQDNEMRATITDLNQLKSNLDLALASLIQTAADMEAKETKKQALERQYQTLVGQAEGADALKLILDQCQQDHDRLNKYRDLMAAMELNESKQFSEDQLSTAADALRSLLVEANQPTLKFSEDRGGAFDYRQQLIDLENALVDGLKKSMSALESAINRN